MCVLIVPVVGRECVVRCLAVQEVGIYDVPLCTGYGVCVGEHGNATCVFILYRSLDVNAW